MDGQYLTEEQKCGLLRLSAELMSNEKAEAEAVEGYTRQLNVLREVRELFPGGEINDMLETIEAATEEKIRDELNHGLSLYAEFSRVTDIPPAED